VTIRTREIYHSANGDRWLLALDSDTNRVFVRHEPNLPSGGQVADIELGAFLIGAGSGPETARTSAPNWNAGQGSECPEVIDNHRLAISAFRAAPARKRVGLG
jgi:hypothetical protein